MAQFFALKPSLASRIKYNLLDGLEPNVIPIEPITRPYQGQLEVERGTYKGQTIMNIIVDIAAPPSYGVSPFSIYVALSRNTGRETIQLLRDFNEKLLMRHPCEFLRKEDKRLEELNNETKAWWNEVKSKGEAVL